MLLRGGGARKLSYLDVVVCKTKKMVTFYGVNGTNGSHVIRQIRRIRGVFVFDTNIIIMIKKILFFLNFHLISSMCTLFK